MATKKVSVGKKVPNFKVPSTSGEIFQLSKMKGKNLVIYFYPKDATPGCTTEGNDFKKASKKFKDLNTEIYGVSRDSIKSHLKFIEKQGFNFDLLSDEDEAVCELFNVMKMKNLYGRKYRGIERSTFFIDEKGVLKEEWRNVKVASHVDEVLKYIKENQK